MKTKLLSLAGVAVCIAALSSCAPYDNYGYAGGGYYGGAPLVSRGVVVDNYVGYNNVGWGNGWGGGWGGYPAYSSVGFFGLGGRGLWGNNHHHNNHYYHGGGSYRQSPANRYASSVARPSSHRGGTVTSRPSIPSVSAPRVLSRPSSSSLSRPSTSRSSSYRSAPSVRSSAPRITTTSSRPSMSRSSSSVSRSSSSRPSSSRGSPSGRSR